MAGCTFATIKYGDIISLRLPLSPGDSLWYLGCGGSGRAIFSGSIDDLGFMTAWKITQGQGNNSPDGAPVVFGDSVIFSQDFGGTNCGQNNVLAMQSTADQIGVFMTGKDNNDVSFSGIVQPGEMVSHFDFRYADPFYLGYNVDGASYWIGVENQMISGKTSGMATAEANLKDAVLLQAASGTTPFSLPDPISCPSGKGMKSLGIALLVIVVIVGIIGLIYFLTKDQREVRQTFPPRAF